MRGFKSFFLGIGLLLAIRVGATQHSWILNHAAFDERKPHWTFSGWREAGDREGIFEGWATWDRQFLTSPQVEVDADRFKYLEIYFDNFGAVLFNKLQFSLDGKTFLPGNAVDFTVSSAYMPLPQRILVDFSSNDNWKGVIRKFRIYFPHRSEGSHVRVYGMRFIEKPSVFYNGGFLVDKSGSPINWDINGKARFIGPESTSSGMPEVSLVDSVISTDLRHMRNEHYYELDFEVKGKTTVVVNLYDSSGKIIEKIECKHNTNYTGWKKSSIEYRVGQNAFRGELVIRSHENGKVRNVLLNYLGSQREQWRASWIWTPAGAKNLQTCYFRKEFNIDKPNLKSALLQTTCDDGVKIILNRRLLFGKAGWATVDVRDVTQYLKDGENVLAARGFNQGAAAGLLVELKLVMKDGSIDYIVTDDNWKVSDDHQLADRDWMGPAPGKGNWLPAKVLGTVPCPPWGALPYSLSSVPKPAEPLPPLATIQNHGITYTIDTQLGYPRIRAGDKILTPFMFGAPWRGNRKESMITSKLSGFDLHRFSFNDFGAAWQRDSYDVDMTAFDRDLETLLRINPEARVIVLFRMTAPPWWMGKYPDEVCRFSDGTTDGHYGILPSMASRRWIEDGKKYLRSAISHMEQAYYADRIVGYMPNSHSGPEWVQTTKPSHFPDYSRPMVEYFREYLRQKYRNLSDLRNAWGDAEVTFENAQIPGRDVRGSRECYFLNPATTQAVLDYNRCYQKSVSSAMLEFQKYIKELSDERRLNFVYYGYVLTFPVMSIYPQTTGHYDLTRVLNSSHLNAGASPIPYSFRRLGDISGCTSVVSSYRLHNKLWINEADVRTNLVIDNFSHKDTYNLKDAASVNIREFAYALTRRLGIWYYDMTGGWFDNPEFIKTFNKMRKIYDYAIEQPIKYKSKVAVFFDETTLDRTSLQREKWGGNNIKFIMGRFQIGLGKAGIPYDTFILDDIYRVNPKQYKCYVFVNMWRRDDQLKRYLEEKILRNGNMVVWIYAPGYSGNELSTDNMRYMTGMEFGIVHDTRLEIITNFSGGFTTGAPGIAPHKSFYAKGDDILTLGKYAENGGTALAMQRGKDWSTVYMAAPDDTGKVWRKLFNDAGIHLFCSRRDRIYYDGEFLGIHLIDGAGKRTINLDRDVNEAWDIFADKKVVVRERKFEVSGRPGETKLFYLGNSEVLVEQIKEDRKNESIDVFE